MMRRSDRALATMKRLRQFLASLLDSLVEDHPSGIPTFPVCVAFDETDCTLRGCYAVGHCRLHGDPGETVTAKAKAPIADGSGSGDGTA